MYLCTDDLSKNKVATQSTTALGPTDAYRAGNAVDRDTETCMRTETIGTSAQTPDKTVWLEVDLGRQYNIYNVNILFKNYDGLGMCIDLTLQTRQCCERWIISACSSSTIFIASETISNDWLIDYMGFYAV